MKRILIIILCIYSIATATYADNARFTASAPATVEAGEMFQVQYTVNTQDVSQQQFPSFTGLELIYGPSTSMQSSFQSINGRTTQTSSITYTFTLKAQKTGTISIPPASIQAGGRTIKSRSLTIKVVKGNQGSQNGSGTTHQDSRRPAAQQNPGRELFITASVTPLHVYEQQALILTYKVYTTAIELSLNMKLPQLDGFQIQQIPLQRKSFTQETYKGKTYNSAIWSQYLLFPQKSGTMDIPAYTFDATASFPNYDLDPFDAFFNGGGMDQVRKKVTAPKVSLRVTPLPDKPDGYSGGVGRFTLTSSINSQTVHAGDALSLKIDIQGTGNMKLISAPHIQFPADFEVYDTKTNDDFDITSDGLTGTRQFEYLAVPRHEGTYTIPAAEFIYFDVNTGGYATLITQPYTITVQKGIITGSSYTEQQDIEEINRDIRYIKTGTLTHQSLHGTDITSWKYWAIYLVCILLAIATSQACRKYSTSAAGDQHTRGRVASKAVRRRLRKAATLLQQHSQAEFYDEIMRALTGYTSDKLAIPQSQLNRDHIQAALLDRGIEQTLITKFITCLDTCEYARYAPGDTGETMETTYNNAADVIEEMENKIKKNKRLSIHTLLTLSLLVTAISQSSTLSAQTKQDADAMYEKGQYTQAMEAYTFLLQKEGDSKELYYNLGNCCYKTDDIAHAILNYERAVLLSPDDKDAQANLSLAKTKIADKVSTPREMFFVTWWKSLSTCLSSTHWLILGVIGFAFALACLVVTHFSPVTLVRRLSSWGLIIGTLLTLTANLSALTQHLLLVCCHDAIVIDPAVTIKSSPDDGSTDLFVIHAGSKVEIIDGDMSQWKQVRVDEGKQGWLHTTSIETILPENNEVNNNKNNNR